MPHQTEPSANAALGLLLQNMLPGSQVRSENTQVIAGCAGQQPDILITTPGHAPVVVEAEYLSAYTAESDARQLKTYRLRLRPNARRHTRKEKRMAFPTPNAVRRLLFAAATVLATVIPALGQGDGTHQTRPGSLICAHPWNFEEATHALAEKRLGRDAWFQAILDKGLCAYADARPLRIKDQNTLYPGLWEVYVFFDERPVPIRAWIHAANVTLPPAEKERRRQQQAEREARERKERAEREAYWKRHAEENPDEVDLYGKRLIFCYGKTEDLETVLRKVTDTRSCDRDFGYERAKAKAFMEALRKRESNR